MNNTFARRHKRPFSALSCSSSFSSSSSDDDDRPHKKLALSLNRLSLNSTPNPSEPNDVEMRPRRWYEKDAFTTVIESLSTTSSDEEEESHQPVSNDSPFPRDEARVTILGEIEKRLNQLPHKLLAPVSTSETALVLYRSPESMGLPKLERQKQEDLKHEMRKRILERRRREQEKLDNGYDADAEDWEEIDTTQPNGDLAGLGHSRTMDHDSDYGEDEGERMDLD